MSKDVVLLAGTRPEAVKAAPVALALAGHPVLRPRIVHSGQHEGMVEQALAPFGLAVDDRLHLRRETGGQPELMAQLLPALDNVLAAHDPVAVIVQGDTTTTLAGALAAFWRRVPVVHLEAGLRTGDLTSPFPEEANRQLVARIAALHLPPTEQAAQALRAESVPNERIVVTGNTVVDAVRHIASAAPPARDPKLSALEHRVATTGGRLVLATVHRRESWGAPLDRVLAAVNDLADAHPDIHVLLPAHPNPLVRKQIAATPAHPRVTVTEPLDYPDLVRALRSASLVLTDSGGIQEEAPSFGVPVLVLRDVTERMEAVVAGCAWLVGTDPTRIRTEADRVLCQRLRVPLDRNPFGDGRAASRVMAALEELLGVTTAMACEAS